MSEPVQQNYSNHRRYDPPYHFFLLGVLSINVLIALWRLIQVFRGSISFGAVFYGFWYVVTSVAFVVLAFWLRIYALKVQDRVIRLEERLRLSSLLPEPLRGRIPELTERQLTGLRFASDGELAGLVQLALDQKLSGEEIKKRIQTWRPDTFRV